MKALQLVVVLAAAAAINAPLSAQEAAARPVVAVQAPGVVPAPAPVLRLRIEEARQSHRHNRLLGSGLISAGAAAVVGALVDWAAGDDLGMGMGGAGAMLGGMSLVAWGADRHVAAREALRRAESWETQVRAEQGRR